MQKVVVAICILGVEFAAFGLAAEATRTKAHDVKIINGICIYPASPAFGLGIAAILVLLIDQIVVSAYTGCVNCRNPRPSGSYWTLPRICFALSWLASLPAFILLLTAAVNQHGLSPSSSTGDSNCAILDPGLFTAGTILGIFAFVLAFISYITTTSSDYARYNQDDRSAHNAVMMTSL